MSQEISTVMLMHIWRAEGAGGGGAGGVLWDLRKQRMKLSVFTQQPYWITETKESICI